jgi:hypothetical protein
LHAQLQAIVRDRGPEAAGGHLPVGLVAPEAGGDNVANNMQAQSDYLRDMVVSMLLLCHTSLRWSCCLTTMSECLYALSAGRLARCHCIC